MGFIDYLDSKTIIIVFGIIIILLLFYFQTKNKEKFEDEKRKMQEEYNKILYRYKNSEGTGIDRYLEKPEDKLQRIYWSLSSKNKQKLIDYAETLEKRDKE